MVAVAEGVLTSKAAYDLSNKLDIECPIIEGIYKVIHRKHRRIFWILFCDAVGADPVQMIDDVMTRTLKEEIDPAVRDAAATNKWH